MNIDRVNYVRAQEGLGPCTPQMMNEVHEAATDDVTQAISFVRASANRFRVDTGRIALAGFSAGATVAMNAAYAQRAQVAAVIALSGRILLSTAEEHITGAQGEPPLLMFVGENDLPSQLESMKSPSGAHAASRTDSSGGLDPWSQPFLSENCGCQHRQWQPDRARIFDGPHSSSASSAFGSSLRAAMLSSDYAPTARGGAAVAGRLHPLPAAAGQA